MNKYIILIFLSVFLLGGLFCYQIVRFNDGKLHLVICNIGQGDGIFIRTPKGVDILVDGGPDDSILNCLSKYMPFWDRDIEVIIATHPDSDHITGLISVLKRYNVIHYFTANVSSSTAVYKRLQDALAGEKLTAKYMYAGDRIDFPDKTSLYALWPKGSWVKGEELQVSQGSQKNISRHAINNFSVVSVLNYKNFKVLLTGDATAAIEERIAKTVGKIDILKVSHHGSKTGFSSLLLEDVKPDLAVISVGAKNKYGHPAKEVLDLLINHKIMVLRTDKNGEVEIATDGNGYKVYSN